jgi:hypothetical protein
MKDLWSLTSRISLCTGRDLDRGFAGNVFSDDLT